jgi:L-alanine-DL-glutamate epimerase-like enolase superfamily enzyme
VDPDSQKIGKAVGSVQQHLSDKLQTLYNWVLCCFTGWLGYSNEKVKTLCAEYLANGFTAFKVKVGQNLEDDRRRCAMVREIIGWDNKLVHTIILCNFP